MQRGEAKKKNRIPVVIFYPGLSQVTVNTRNCFMFDCGTKALIVPTCTAPLQNKAGVLAPAFAMPMSQEGWHLTAPVGRGEPPAFHCWQESSVRQSRVCLWNWDLRNLGQSQGFLSSLFPQSHPTVVHTCPVYSINKIYQAHAIH